MSMLNQIAGLIHLSGRLLDEGKFSEYADLYTDTGEYRLHVDAPEIAQQMTWILLNQKELSALLSAAKDHVWNTGQRSHLITVESVDLDNQGVSAESSASFCVFRTDADGTPSVYAVGRYQDDWMKTGGEWKIVRRIATLGSRNLSPPSAIPL